MSTRSTGENAPRRAVPHCLHVLVVVQWIAVGGLNLSVSGPTITTATTAAAGEILILMATSDPQGAGALARTFDGSGQRIELYRKDAPNGTAFAHLFTWPTNPSDSAFVSLDVSSVVLHELGHALGLKEHGSFERSVMCGRTLWPYRRSGPSLDDVNRIRNAYASQLATTNRVRARSSIDNGVTWQNMNLPTATADATITTAHDPAAVRDNTRWLLAYARSDIKSGNSGRHPEVIVAGDAPLSTIEDRELFTAHMSVARRAA